MGWSATKKACDTMETLDRKCKEISGMSNRYTGTDGKTYFYQIGREQQDGAIVGQVFLMDTGANLCWRKGSFKISADGKIARKPLAFPLA